MTALRLDPNLDDPDGVYAALAQVLDRCGNDQAVAFLARLSLILANQVGEKEVVRAAIAEAAEALGTR